MYGRNDKRRPHSVGRKPSERAEGCKGNKEYILQQQLYVGE